MKIIKKIKSAIPTVSTRQSSSSPSISNVPKPIIKKINIGAKLDPLSLARAKKQEQRDAGEVDKRRSPLEVHLADPKSMRKAINANCYDCCGQESYVKRIRYCNIFECSFWLLRPYSKGITKADCENWVEETGTFKDEETV